MKIGSPRHLGDTHRIPTQKMRVLPTNLDPTSTCQRIQVEKGLNSNASTSAKGKAWAPLRLAVKSAPGKRAPFSLLGTLSEPYPPW
jgi:hypothetical protein